MDTPKGKRAVRLPLSAQAIATLRALQATQPPTPEGWVFPSSYGRHRPWSRTHLRRVLHKACRRARILPVSMHVLRHSFITAAAATGTDPWTVQQLARHRNIATTQAYIHLAKTSPHHAAAIDAVEHYLMPRPTPPAPSAGA